MIYLLQEKATAAKGSWRTAQANIARFHVGPGTIIRLDIWFDFAPIRGGTFTLKINGVDQFPDFDDKPALAAFENHVFIDGLSAAIADGDIVSFDLVSTSFRIDPPGYFQITIDDGLPNAIGPGLSVDNNIATWDGVDGNTLKDSGKAFSTDDTLAADSDDLIPTQKAVKGYVDDSAGSGDVAGPGSATDNGIALFDGTTGKLIKDSVKTLSIDGTLAGNSDALVPTQKAVKTYADALANANDALQFKGVINCSTNPNYPAADAGHVYRVSVAGKIGGASGVNVEVADQLLCITDGTSAGTQAGVGANWSITQANIDGAVIGPASATNNGIPLYDGTTGKLIKDSAAVISTDGTLASNSDAKVPTEKAVKLYADSLGFSNEAAQDAVGGILDNGTVGDVIFTYDDATPKISGVLGDAFISRLAIFTPPLFRAAGAVAQNAGAVVGTLPAGLTQNDIMIALTETNPSEPMTAPSGWTDLGVPTGNGASQLGVFWKRAGASESAPTFPDSGDHNTVVIFAVSGCVATGNPINAFQVANAAASGGGTTSLTIAGVTTTVSKTLVIYGLTCNSGTAGAGFSGWANASLTGVGEIVDVAPSSPVRHIGAAQGTFVGKGATGTMSVTFINTSSFGGSFCLALSLI